MKVQSLNTRDQPNALRGRGDLAFRQTLVRFAYERRKLRFEADAIRR